MRLIHTGDWHLGDRLGRVDRTEDIRRNVERVAALCDEQDVDVLLVAGDLFSELMRPDRLPDTLEHLNESFAPLLRRGGTIAAITGNHDNETIGQTIRALTRFVAPGPDAEGTVLERGRFHLMTQPGLSRLRGRDGRLVQLVSLPYPTPSRYLEGKRFTSVIDRNKALRAAVAERVRAFRASPDYDKSLPSILMAHLHLQEVPLPGLFRITDEESILVGLSDLLSMWTYVALGHIHRPQMIGNAAHVRYCGSVERLDLGEEHDPKSVALVDVSGRYLDAAPVELPLEATPIAHVRLADPASELDDIRSRVPEPDRTLVKLEYTYIPGRDDPQAVEARLMAAFPRWYELRRVEPTPFVLAGGAIQPRGRSVRETVRAYLEDRLTLEDPDRRPLLALAEAVLSESDGAAAP